MAYGKMPQICTYIY